MRFNEFATAIKSPEQLRVDALQAARDKAAKALADERKRQKVVKAQKNLAVAMAPSVPSPIHEGSTGQLHTYIVIVRVTAAGSSASIRTLLHAEGIAHARMLAQHMYGVSNVLSVV